MWREQAACLGADQTMFFPNLGQRPTAAHRVCRTCPVADPCLDAALAEVGENDWGVWGGTSADERAAVRLGRISRAQLATIRDRRKL